MHSVVVLGRDVVHNIESYTQKRLFLPNWVAIPAKTPRSFATSHTDVAEVYDEYTTASLATAPFTVPEKKSLSGTRDWNVPDRSIRLST
jgi:hypothetical protein